MHIVKGVNECRDKRLGAWLYANTHCAVYLVQLISDLAFAKGQAVAWERDTCTWWKSKCMPGGSGDRMLEMFSVIFSAALNRLLFFSPL